MNWSNCVENIGGVDIPTFKCIEVIFARILTITVSLAVLALFVMLVVGGFKFLTSAGDQKATASAQQTMTYAIMGIGLMLVAYLIFRILEVFTGINLTTFQITP